MEREALLLRLRAEHAKLAAEYADEQERRIFEQQARAYEAQAIEIENRLDLWLPEPGPAVLAGT
jgi:hypothetical protein